MGKVAISFCYICVTYLLYYVFVFFSLSLSLTYYPQFIMHYFSYVYLFLHTVEVPSAEQDYISTESLSII